MALQFDSKKNFSYSVIAVAPSPANSGTSLQVAPGDGDKFPTPPFNAVVWPTEVQPTTANAEVVRVTAKSTDTFTIVRTQESSNARSILVNDQIMVGPTAKAMTDIENSFRTASALTVPIGTMAMWLVGTVPAGWLLCQGQAVSRAAYPELFALWSTFFGAGDGSTTFGIPDLRGRIPIGLTSGITALDLVSKAPGVWDHTHGPGSLTVASHAHGPGTLGVSAHAHAPGTLQVESHTHGPGTLAVASHTHGPGTLGTNSVNIDHTHNMDHNHDMGNHTHGFSGTTDFSGAFTAADNEFPALDISGDHTHTFSGTTAGPSTNLTSGPSSANTGGMSTSASHSHSVNGGNTAAASPAVSSGVTASTAPFVTGGATAANTAVVESGLTALASPAVNSGVTGAGNPPVYVVNFMVRASNEV